MATHLASITALLNRALKIGFSLSACDDNLLSLKTMGVLYGLSILANLFGTTCLAFLLFVAALTLPVGYELKKAEVDAAYASASAAASDLYASLLAKIPKAADLKEEEKKKL